jgi:hypothetical protein
MPASLPGLTKAENVAVSATSAGIPVVFDLLHGPKGSPLDKDYDVTAHGLPADKASTGFLSTGIGFGLNVGPQGFLQVSNYSFTDDYIPGQSKPDKTLVGNSTYMYIGGGKSEYAGKYYPATDPAGTSRNVPYVAGFGIGVAGNGAGRDLGTGPAYTSGTLKLVTNGAVDLAPAGVIETGYTNRSGLTLPANHSQFGASAAMVVPSSVENKDEHPVAKVKVVKEKEDEPKAKKL